MQGNILKGIMAEQEVTQTGLAKEIGMSKNTLNAKINGKVPITDIEIFKICKALHITDPVLKCRIFLSEAS